MPQVHFELETALPPDAVLRVLTDFSDRRAQVWPNIDKDHLKVHAQGPGWAEVTEGNARAGGIWERNRYEWGQEPGRLTIMTVESNTWKPGSRWDYRLTPAGGGGTRVSVDVLRMGRGAKGVLVGTVIGLFGSRILRADMATVLAQAGSREGKGAPGEPDAPPPVDPTSR